MCKREDENGKPACEQCNPKDDIHVNVSSTMLGADKLFGRRVQIPLHELALLESSLGFDGD